MREKIDIEKRDRERRERQREREKMVDERALTSVVQVILLKPSHEL